MGALDSLTNSINPISQGLGIVKGGIQLFNSMSDLKKNESELSKLSNPFYNIQDEYYQNRNLAGELATGGMPVASKDYYTTESQRGLGAGISGTLQSGGSPNDIAKMFDVYNRSIDRTAAEDAKEHINNIQYLMGANKDLAGQKTIQWGLNEKQPYENKVRQLSANISADKQNISGGADTAIGSLGALGTGLQNNSLLSSLFSNAKMDNSGQLTFRGSGAPDRVSSLTPNLSVGGLAPATMPSFGN